MTHGSRLLRTVFLAGGGGGCRTICVGGVVGVGGMGVYMEDWAGMGHDLDMGVVWGVACI